MLIEELKMIPKSRLKIYCDNLSCIFLANNPKHYEKRKHINVKYHFIHEIVEDKRLILEHTPTTLMWADFLTKPLPTFQHESSCNNSSLKRTQQ